VAGFFSLTLDQVADLSQPIRTRTGSTRRR
jgi:hypothetical protein